VERVEDSEMYSAITILMSIASKVNPTELPACIELLLADMDRTFPEHLALHAVTELFNFVPVGPFRLPVVKALCQLGATHPDCTKTVATMIATKSIKWARVWELPPREAGMLHLAVAEVAHAAMPVQSNPAQVLALYTAGLLALDRDWSAVPQSVFPVVQAAIKRAIVCFLTYDVYECDFLSCKVVEKMASGTPHYTIITAMMEGNVEGVKKALKNTPALVAELNTSEEAFVLKTRHMALLALAQKARGGAVPYTRIAEALALKEDEVEAMVVSAIRRGLLEASMDQVRAEVTFSKYTFRVFGTENWTEIAAKLREFQASLAVVPAAIDRAAKMSVSDLRNP
jgi:hypothetical protein